MTRSIMTRLECDCCGLAFIIDGNSQKLPFGWEHIDIEDSDFCPECIPKGEERVAPALDGNGDPIVFLVPEVGK